MDTALHVVGNLFVLWAVGLACVTVLMDTGPGFLRDHPPPGRRLGGALAGPLAAAGMICLLATGHHTLACLAVFPFSLFGLAYTWAWVTRQSADTRRQVGLYLFCAAVVALLGMMLMAGVGRSHGGVVMAAFGGSAALLGGLTALLLIQFNHLTPNQLRCPERVYSLLRQALGVGAGLIMLALWEVLPGFAALDSRAILSLLSWALLCGLSALLAATCGRLAPGRQSMVLAGALAVLLVGQSQMQLLLATHPGLVPLPL